jgi:hypothetical protein
MMKKSAALAIAGFDDSLGIKPVYPVSRAAQDVTRA